MSLRTSSVFVALALAAAAAAAQSAPSSTAPSAGPAGQAPECATRAPVHDHGRERGFPVVTKPCEAAASTPGAIPRESVRQAPATGHDHGKVHKHQ